MSPFKSSIIKLCNLITVLFFIVNAQNSFPKSGLFTIMNPDSSAAYVNSSITGSALPVIYPSSVAGDILMTPDSVKYASGIYTDTIFDKLLDFTEFQSISSQDICYYFDLLFKKKAICAPEDIYASAAPAGKKLYFFKTSANRYGAILKIGEYSGETDMAHYYIVCSDSGSTILYKKSPSPSLSAISVSATIFSGRPDPVFTITDSLSVNSIFESLVNLRYPAPDTGSSLTDTSIAACENLFLGTLRYCPINSIDTCTIIVGNHSIFYSDSKGSSKIVDYKNTVQRIIVSAGRKDNLSYTDEYGTVYFRDLFPECTAAKRHYLQKNNISADSKYHNILLRGVNASCNIPFYTVKQVLSYKICTLQGRTLMSGFLEPQTQTLTINNLKSGIYMCVLGNGSDRKNTVFIAR